MQPKTKENDLLDYYARELAYLRSQGQNFARRYPKVASQLDYHGTESQDPHTERLIESFAFLAARVHRDLDTEFPQVASGLLENLCPTMLAPIPSMTIIEFGLNGAQGKVTAGLAVPRHTAIVAEADTGEECRFRTGWDTTLWPLRIDEALLDDDGKLVVTVVTEHDANLAELEIDTLRVHLSGDWSLVGALYECLATKIKSIQIENEQGVAHTLPAASCRNIGFDAAFQLLPQAPGAHPAYGLLQEYFAFPAKFHFFDISGLRAAKLSGSRFTLRFDVGGVPRKLRALSAENFRLGCVAAINLFPRSTEPILIDHRQHEILLVADRAREAITEIHSIELVTASDPGSDRPQSIPQFSALGHGSEETEGVFWAARRERSMRRDISGTDMHLSFVNQRNTRSRPTAPVVYARTLCTNRGLAEQISTQTRLKGEGISNGLRIRCLTEPSRQRNPPLDGDTIWRLASLLTLSHDSLVSGETGRNQLREMLSLFASDHNRDLEQIRGITGLSAHGVTRRIHGDAWRGYCRGTGVRLELDPDAFAGSSPVLFSAVLARFFALYTTINSFVQLGIYRGEECLTLWHPISGAQELI